MINKNHSFLWKVLLQLILFFIDTVSLSIIEFDNNIYIN